MEFRLFTWDTEVAPTKASPKGAQWERMRDERCCAYISRLTLIAQHLATRTLIRYDTRGGRFCTITKTGDASYRSIEKETVRMG